MIRFGRSGVILFYFQLDYFLIEHCLLQSQSLQLLSECFRVALQVLLQLAKAVGGRLIKV